MLFFGKMAKKSAQNLTTTFFICVVKCKKQSAVLTAVNIKAGSAKL
jgi:hypothetical protein